MYRSSLLLENTLFLNILLRASRPVQAAIQEKRGEAQRGKLLRHGYCDGAKTVLENMVGSLVIVRNPMCSPNGPGATVGENGDLLDLVRIYRTG